MISVICHLDVSKVDIPLINFVIYSCFDLFYEQKEKIVFIRV